MNPGSLRGLPAWQKPVGPRLKPTQYRFDQRALKTGGGLVALDPRLPKPQQHRTDVLVLELDRALGALVQQRLQTPTMLGVAEELVGAQVATERVDARAAAQHIVLHAAVEVIRAIAAVEEVEAALAEELDVLRAARERVVADAAGEEIDARAPFSWSLPASP